MTVATSNNIGYGSRTITVTPINVAPTLNPIQSPAPILEDSSPLTIDLSGISAGGGQSQTLTLTASANPAGLITFAGGTVGIPGINYTSPNTTGSLSFEPTPGASGTATITVTVTEQRRHRQPAASIPSSKASR